MPNLKCYTQLSFLAELSEQTVTQLEECGRVNHYRKGAFLFHQDWICSFLHVILQGRVKLYRSNPEGKEQVLTFCTSGEILSLAPFYSDRMSLCSAQALDETSVLEVPIEAFRDLLTHRVDFAAVLARQAAQRYRELSKLLEMVVLKDVTARVAGALTEFAPEKALSTGDEFVLHYKQDEVAHLLGTTRESVARSLSRLEHNGVIARTGNRFRVLNKLLLASIAEGTASIF